MWVQPAFASHALSAQCHLRTPSRPLPPRHAGQPAAAPPPAAPTQAAPAAAAAAAGPQAPAEIRVLEVDAFASVQVGVWVGAAAVGRRPPVACTRAAGVAPLAAAPRRLPTRASRAATHLTPSPLWMLSGPDPCCHPVQQGSRQPERGGRAGGWAGRWRCCRVWGGVPHGQPRAGAARKGALRRGRRAWAAAAADAPPAPPIRPPAMVPADSHLLLISPPAVPRLCDLQPTLPPPRRPPASTTLLPSVNADLRRLPGLGAHRLQARRRLAPHHRQRPLEEPGEAAGGWRLGGWAAARRGGPGCARFQVRRSGGLAVRAGLKGVAKRAPLVARLPLRSATRSTPGTASSGACGACWPDALAGC